MPQFLIPVLAVVILGVTVGLARPRVPPGVALWTVGALAALVTVISVATLLGLAGSYLLDTNGLGAVVGLCEAVTGHRHVPWWLGTTALAGSVVVVFRMVRAARRRRVAESGHDGRRFELLETSTPIAFAAPGSPGCVVVSRGMLDALDPAERRVLIAHERAHLEGHHHRFLMAADMAVAAMPLFAPLARQVRLATERSADEMAAAAMGGDRGLVARAIAHAALAGGPAPDGGFLGNSVVARVRALSRAPVGAGEEFLTGTGGAVICTAAAILGVVQVARLMALVAHLCG